MATHIINVEMHARQTSGFWVHYTCPQGCLTGYVWGEELENLTTAVSAISYDHARQHILKEDR